MPVKKNLLDRHKMRGGGLYFPTSGLSYGQELINDESPDVTISSFPSPPLPASHSLDYSLGWLVTGGGGRKEEVSMHSSFLYPPLTN